MNLTVSKQTQNFIDCMAALGDVSCRIEDALEEMYGGGVNELSEEAYDASQPLMDLIKKHLCDSIHSRMDDNGNFKDGI